MQQNNYYKNCNLVGKNIKKYRIKNNLTQEQLCNQVNLLGLNLYHSDIHLIETNKRIVKDFEVFAFSKVFGISLSEIYNNNTKEFLK